MIKKNDEDIRPHMVRLIGNNVVKLGLFLLLSNMTAVAMETLVKTKNTKKERFLKVQLEDGVMEIPLSQAFLSKVFRDLAIDVVKTKTKTKTITVPLPGVTERDFGRVARRLLLVQKHAQENTLETKQVLRTSLEELLPDELISCIKIANYLHIQVLLDGALEVACQKCLLSLLWDKLKALPVNMRNKLLIHQAIMLFGPYQSRELTLSQKMCDKIGLESMQENDTVVSGFYNYRLWVWNMRDQELSVFGCTPSVYASCGMNKNVFILGHSDGSLCVRNMAGEKVAEWRAHDSSIRSLCATTDGKIVTGSIDGTARIWRMTGQELGVCQGQGFQIKSLCMIGDSHIVTICSDRTLRIWDMAGKEIAVCRGHEKGIHSVYATEDGIIVSGSLDKTVRIWDIAGKEIAVCCGHEEIVRSVWVTKDGIVISGSSDKTVRIWDMTGQEIAVCRGHEGAVSSVCTTDDGKIVSGSWDKTVRIWEITGQQVGVCRGHEDWVESVKTTPDGKIISGSSDRRLCVWNSSLMLSTGQAQRVWQYLQEVSRGEAIELGWEILQSLQEAEVSRGDAIELGWETLQSLQEAEDISCCRKVANWAFNVYEKSAMARWTSDELTETYLVCLNDDGTTSIIVFDP